MGNSSRTTSSEKPRKQRNDFHLFVHKGTGRWCKKVKGRHRYLGYAREDPKGDNALKLWLDQRRLG